MVEVKKVACDLNHLITPKVEGIHKGNTQKEYTKGYDTPSFFTLT